MAHSMPRIDVYSDFHHRPQVWDSGPPPSGGVRSYRSGFWGTLPVRMPAGGSVSIRLRAVLADGEIFEAPLGTIEAESERPPPEPSDARLAICMATFNPDPDLFRAQVDSIREQTMTDWICLVSDDCSTPEHRAMIEATVGADVRFRVSSPERRLGFYRNFERSLSLVPRGVELVALSDQDDRWYPEKLEVLASELGPSQLVYSGPAARGRRRSRAGADLLGRQAKQQLHQHGLPADRKHRDRGRLALSPGAARCGSALPRDARAAVPRPLACTRRQRLRRDRLHRPAAVRLRPARRRGDRLRGLQRAEGGSRRSDRLPRSHPALRVRVAGLLLLRLLPPARPRRDAAAAPRRRNERGVTPSDAKARGGGALAALDRVADGATPSSPLRQDRDARCRADRPLRSPLAVRDRGARQAQPDTHSRSQLRRHSASIAGTRRRVRGAGDNPLADPPASPRRSSPSSWRSRTPRRSESTCSCRPSSSSTCSAATSPSSTSLASSPRRVIGFGCSPSIPPRRYRLRGDHRSRPTPASTDFSERSRSASPRDQDSPVEVNPRDAFVATTWWTAHIANAALPTARPLPGSST